MTSLWLKPDDPLALVTGFGYSPSMIAFWAVAGLLSAAAATFLMASAARAGAQGSPMDPGAALYRRQLNEIGELADRGLLPNDERRAAEAEAGRRLLTAAGRAEPTWTGGGFRGPLLAAALAAPLSGVGVYLVCGAPGMADQPFANRLKHWGETPAEVLSPAEIAALIGSRLSENPDPDGFRFLAIAQNAAGNQDEAIRALRRGLRLEPGRADLWEALGVSLVEQAGGQLTDPARRAFAETLKHDPRSLTARFYMGRAKMDDGLAAEGLADWKALLADLPAGNANRDQLQAAIAQAEGAVPAQALVQAMAPPTPAAIRGMVDGLAARLKSQPDDPEGWVRLVRAYGVLGEAAPRDAALAQARARYAGDPAILQALEDAARAAPRTQGGGR